MAVSRSAWIIRSNLGFERLYIPGCFFLAQGHGHEHSCPIFLRASAILLRRLFDLLAIGTLRSIPGESVRLRDDVLLWPCFQHL